MERAVNRDHGTDVESDKYQWDSSAAIECHGYLAPVLIDVLSRLKARSVLDLGCGNGALTGQLHQAGFKVTGVERSSSGLAHARKTWPQIEFLAHDLDQPLPPELVGRFPVVVAAEVIEHLLLPRQLFIRAKEALVPGGKLVISTPYHGYLKNVLIALAGKFDQHVDVNWDYGHVKFFSKRSLGSMATSQGFEIEGWRLIGRIPPLAKSMILVASNNVASLND